MSTFPLYDNLLSEVTSYEDLTTKQKDEFMKVIVSIDDNATELVYALIRVYQLENSDNKNTFTLPYDGKYVDENKDIRFDLNELPNQLKQMLYNFLKLYKNRE
jgi:UTP:GlnB (protein PII) uridylyltransferase